MITKLQQLLIKAKEKPRRLVIVQAADSEMLETVSAVEFEHQIASCILLGPRDQIKSLAEAKSIPIKDEQIVHMEDETEMAKKAVAMVRAGEADLPMKGMVQTSTFIKAVLDKETGLRGEGLLSELTVFEKEWGRPGLQIATCCALNINPDLNAKVQIIRNAVKLAAKLGITVPKVACVCALEQVNPDMPETVDAAVLSKMSERGQIKNCLIDGPLALDNAVSPEGAKHKGLSGEVAGQADILLMSDIRMGNVFHKALTYMAKKRVAIAVIGAKVPILMNSRSDAPADKLLSVALAQCLLD